MDRKLNPGSLTTATTILSKTTTFYNTMLRTTLTELYVSRGVITGCQLHSSPAIEEAITDKVTGVVDEVCATFQERRPLR